MVREMARLPGSLSLRHKWRSDLVSSMFEMKRTSPGRLSNFHTCDALEELFEDDRARRYDELNERRRNREAAALPEASNSKPSNRQMQEASEPCWSQWRRGPERHSQRWRTSIGFWSQRPLEGFYSLSIDEPSPRRQCVNLRRFNDAARQQIQSGVSEAVQPAIPPRRFRRSTNLLIPRYCRMPILTSPQASHTFVYVSTIQRMDDQSLRQENAFPARSRAIPDYEEDAGKLDIPIHAFERDYRR